MLAPFGDGCCIINEELYVTNATDEQRKVRAYPSSKFMISLLWSSGVMEHHKFYSYISLREIVLKMPIWKEGGSIVTITISSLQARQIIAKYGPSYLKINMNVHVLLPLILWLWFISESSTRLKSNFYYVMNFFLCGRSRREA
jgi:hypothetical protein